MKTQRLLGLLVVGVVSVAMLGIGFFATPYANAQSGARVQAGSGTVAPQGSVAKPLGSSTIQQGSATTQQGSVTKPQGSATTQQGSMTKPQGSSAAKQGSDTKPQGSSTTKQGSSTTKQGSSTTKQGSSTTKQGSAAKQAEAAARADFDKKMWTFIKNARYTQWAPAGDNGDYRVSNRPHGAFVKTYMNRAAAGNTTALPHGSVIVKENYSPDKTLVAVTLMHRSKGYNPDGNDWYWIKYNADGTTAMADTPNGKMAISGKAQGCMDCHSGADGGDYAFFND